jgi:hypothetical protein
MFKFLATQKPADKEKLGEWAQNQFDTLTRAIGGQTELLWLKTRHEAPVKIREGMVVLADGTDWDPGSGQGVYCYYNSQWNKLG